MEELYSIDMTTALIILGVVLLFGMKIGARMATRGFRLIFMILFGIGIYYYIEHFGVPEF